MIVAPRGRRKNARDAERAGWRAQGSCGMMARIARRSRMNDSRNEVRLSLDQMNERLARFSELEPYRDALHETLAIGVRFGD
jgi:hypothetical protein